MFSYTATLAVQKKNHSINMFWQRSTLAHYLRRQKRSSLLSISHLKFKTRFSFFHCLVIICGTVLSPQHWDVHSEYRLTDAKVTCQHKGRRKQSSSGPWTKASICSLQSILNYSRRRRRAETLSAITHLFSPPCVSNINVMAPILRSRL